MNCCTHACREGRDCPNHSALMNNARRYPRTLADAFPDVRACAIEKPMPRSLRASPSFYIGGLASLLVWWLLYAPLTA